MPDLSIVVPTLDEAEGVVATLEALQLWREAGAEIIVVDGGSTDGTAARAAPLADSVLSSSPGRARQQNAGAAVAGGRLLVFVHADTTLPSGALPVLLDLARGEPCWGRFDVRLSGDHPLLRIVEWLMNARSRLTGICTGDQGLFVSRELFDEVGGFPDQPLMEDIAITDRLRRHVRPHCLRARVVTSSRRWEREGIVRTILRMWALRLAYALGVSPARLAACYAQVR